MEDSDSWGTIDYDENDSYLSSEFSEEYDRREVKSLVESCVTCVAKNFPRFNLAFLNTEDRRLRRNLVFLQRIYTYQLIDKLNDTICKEYARFFLNDHLKDFNLTFFEKNCYPEIIGLIKEVAHTFSTINMETHGWFTSEPFPLKHMCDILSSSPNVERLELPSYVDNQVFNVLITFCQNLKILKFENDAIFSHEDFIKVLKNIPTLQEIKLIELPKIIYLAHKQDYQNNTLNTVSKYNLVELDFRTLIENSSDFDEQDLIDILAVCGELCPLVNTINIVPTLQKHLDLLTAFQELQNLKIRGFYINVNELLKSKADKLKKLSLKTCNVSFSALLNCSKLKELELNHVTFDNILDIESYLLNDLEKLTISNVIFENSSDFANNVHLLKLILSSSSRLSRLSLFECDIAQHLPQSIILKSFSNIALKEITFSNLVGVTPDLVKSIVETCKHECELSLIYCSPMEYKDLPLIKMIDSKVKLNFHKDLACHYSEEYLDYEYEFPTDSDDEYDYDYAEYDDAEYYSDDY